MEKDIFNKDVSLKNEKEISKFQEVYNSTTKNIDDTFKSKFSDTNTKSFKRIEMELKKK